MARLIMDHVHKVYDDGTRAVTDLSIKVEDGELLVLVGPSGCGKSTALRMVAGLEEISHGRMIVGNKVVNNLPAKSRDIAMVFQSYALYPHMTIGENMGFALKMAKLPKAEIEQRVTEAARILGIEEQLNRKPRNLSGGQRQRVAMGRAIVRAPQAFLMDEPLSNLDAKLRVQMRAEISQLVERLGVTTLYVTHDQIEAMTMGDRVAVMKLGVLQQIDTPARLFSHPANLFVASFIGSPPMNLVHATIARGESESGYVTRFGRAELGIPQKVLDKQPSLKDNLDRDVAVGLRPDFYFRPDGSVPAERRFEVEVALVELLGTEVLVHMRAGTRTVVSEDTQLALDSSDAAEEALRASGTDEAESSIIGKFPITDAPRLGERFEVGFDTMQLHFFDMTSGDAFA